MTMTRTCVLHALALLLIAAPLRAQTPTPETPSPPPHATAPEAPAAREAPPAPAEERAPPTDAMPFQPNLPFDPSRKRGDAPGLRVDAENGVAFPTDI